MNPDCAAPKLRELPLAQRRVIRGWCIFDWANSAFATSGTAAIFPVYFVLLFQKALGDGTVFLGFAITGSSLWSIGVILSTATVALTSPIFGILSDHIPIKKTLLVIYTLTGSVFTMLAFFSAYTPAPWAWLFGAFVIGNIGFSGSLVFYNALLPHISPKHLLDEVSSMGFAYGYIGGGILLAIHLALITAFQGSNVADLVTRLSISSVGIWWVGWAIWTFKTVPEPSITNPKGGLTVTAALRFSLSELWLTTQRIKDFKVLAFYLGAYLLFNDGIQTVMAIAGAYAADTLGVSLVFNMITILLIQLIAAPGALLFAWVASLTTTKTALVLSLAGWCLIVMLGVGIIPLIPTSQGQFDYQFVYDEPTASYLVLTAPNLSDSERDISWNSIQQELAGGDRMTLNQTTEILKNTGESTFSRFSLTVHGGPLAGTTAIGPNHPAKIDGGYVDWFPLQLRSLIWSPLQLSANMQWLILGSAVGVVMGGSQALARSLFAQLSPNTRSGEFFSFFGFVGRASAVLGPMLYVLVTGILDTRTAVLSLMLIIVAGTLMLGKVDVKSGRVMASEEDIRPSTKGN